MTDTTATDLSRVRYVVVRVSTPETRRQDAMRAVNERIRTALGRFA